MSLPLESGTKRIAAVLTNGDTTVKAFCPGRDRCCHPCPWRGPGRSPHCPPAVAARCAPNPSPTASSPCVPSSNIGRSACAAPFSGPHQADAGHACLIQRAGGEGDGVVAVRVGLRLMLHPVDVRRRVDVLSLAGDAEPDIRVAAAAGGPSEPGLAGYQCRQRGAPISPLKRVEGCFGRPVVTWFVPVRYQMSPSFS